MGSEALGHFSHVYVEGDCLDAPLTKQVLERFRRATVVEIGHYKDVFNRPGQRFQLQKQSMKLILARKREPLIYDGSPFAPNFGEPNFFYNAPILNCAYNCDYCYLQGMYPSANMVVFVNQDEMAAEADRVLEERGSIYLCVSYDTDLLAFEKVVPLSRFWIEWAASREGALIELRTKSANFRAVSELAANARTVMAWTLSPESVAIRHELKTAPPKLRMQSMAAAMDAGWPVRACIDPIIAVPDWREQYGELVEQMAEMLPLQALRDVSLGTFRMNKDYLQRIRKQRQDTAVLYHAFAEADGCAVYDEILRREMLEFVRDRLVEHAPEVTINVFG
jgi:spore photoproduct lyase